LDEDGARVWDLSSTKPVQIWEISGFNRYSFSLAFANNGTELVSVTDEYYKFFPVSDSSIMEPSRQIQLPGVRGHNMAVSPDGSRLAYNSAEEILIGENNPDGQNWQTLSKFPKPLTYDRDLDLTFSPDGSLLASYEPDDMVRLWNLADLTYLNLALEPGAFVSEFLFSPDGTLLLGAYPHTAEPSTFYLWNTRTGKLLRQWTSQMYKLAFHPRQPTLIGVDYMTGIVRFFDLRTGDVIKEIRADKGIQEIAISPDGSLLALGYDDKFEIRDAESMTLLKEISISPNILVFSPDGSKIAVALTDGRIQFWGWRDDEK
jgi:WD40 repeat protein